MNKRCLECLLVQDGRETVCVVCVVCVLCVCVCVCVCVLCVCVVCVCRWLTRRKTWQVIACPPAAPGRSGRGLCTTFTYICMHAYTHTHTHTERERERDTHTQTHRHTDAQTHRRTDTRHTGTCTHTQANVDQSRGGACGGLGRGHGYFVSRPRLHLLWRVVEDDEERVQRLSLHDLIHAGYIQ